MEAAQQTEEQTHTPDAPQANQVEEMEHDTRDAVALSFPKAVMRALRMKKISSRCQSCQQADGWQKAWELIPIPCVQPTIDPNTLVFVAALVCKSCASVRNLSLGYLDIQLKREERSIITPAEAAQRAASPIIAP